MEHNVRDFINTRTKLHDEMIAIERQQEEIDQHAEELEMQIKKLRAQREALRRQSADLDTDLARHQVAWNEYAQWNGPRVLEFVKRTQKIERRLVKQVEGELRGSKHLSPLAAPDDKPKLSLLLNCFELSPHVIETTANLSSESLMTADRNDLTTQYGDKLSPEEISDLLYCGEMLRHKFPYAQHQMNCPVCHCHTPQQLLVLLQEHAIALPPDLVRKRHLNGPRTLYMSSIPEFREYKDELRALRRLHVTVLAQE